jgi:hypothetical protein
MAFLSTGCAESGHVDVPTGAGGTNPPSMGIGGMGASTVSGAANTGGTPTTTGEGGGDPMPTGEGGSDPAGQGGTGGTVGVGGTGVSTTGIAGTGAPERGGTSGTSSSCTTTGAAGTGGTIQGRGPTFQPNPGIMTTLSTPPPAVSGGTLRVLANGTTAIAADADRDSIFIVDLAGRAVVATIALGAGDEPGRVIEDGAGRVHVALRRGGAIVSFTPGPQPEVTRQPVCASPRGMAYDAGADLVHVACADGELVSLPAAGGAAVRTLQLDRDLRDVVVDGSRLRVSRFRSAELMTIEADGTVSTRIGLPNFSTSMARSGQRFTAGTAYRMTAGPDGSVVMLHQRGVVDGIRPQPGGYGGFNPCNSIVHAAVSSVAADGTVKTGPVLAGLVLAIDMAISPDGSKVAFVSMGNSSNTIMGSTASAPQLTRTFVMDMNKATDGTIGCKPDGMNGPCLPPSTTLLDSSTGTSLTGCQPNPQVVGQPVAVAFAGDGTVVTQSREPAMLALADGTNIPLSSESRGDTGHFFFHANAGGNIACASCHVEGDDDGRVWNFECSSTNPIAAMGPRRTQSLQTGLRGTEPFHWSGDEADFSALMSDVFVGRMSGPKLTTGTMEALVSWIDAQPKPRRPTPANAAAVARGAALFNDTQNVGCVTCHAGARFSANLTVDVGTGGAFQVPSLIGIGTRGPFMHDGCAATLHDRFNPACGGGDRHGITSRLSSAQIDDLVAYLQSL